MLEIERKFLVKELPDLTGCKNSMITQSYSNKRDDFYEIRLRNYDDKKYYLDFKGRGTLIREENGIKITKEQYDKLNIMEKHIVKQRYYIKENIFLDVYKGELEGLIMVEVEGNLDYVTNFKPLKWFDKEVTEDQKYKNRNLFESLH